MKLITATILSLGLATSASFAAGTAPAPSGTTTSPTQLHCKAPQVVITVRVKHKKVKICGLKKADLIQDNELFQQGRLLAKQGQYDWAISVLSSIDNQNDPAVLNYLGYSNRKAGRLEIAITYYNKALAIDPNYVLAREYLGEGYVAAGRLDLAQIQLDEIANRAGKTSDEYVDLAKAIKGSAI